MLDYLLWLVWVPVLGYLFYRWSTSTYGYFAERNVPFVKPVPLFGQILDFVAQNRHAVDVASEGYDKFTNTRVSGAFSFRKPTYLIHDPELYKLIATKDFDHFTDHVSELHLDTDPLLARSLFFTQSSHWRHHRHGMSPAFTGSKMRNMFVLLSSSVEKAMKQLTGDLGGKAIQMEGRDFYSRLGNDVMTTISFGVEVDSLRDRDNPFYVKGKRLAKIDGLPGFKLLLATITPWLMRMFNLGVLYKDVNEFYLDAVSKNIRYREENKINRPDFIHLLLQARKNELSSEKAEDDLLENAGFATATTHQIEFKENVELEWTDVDITAAAVSFFFGGIETTTTLLCFATYEIAVNPDIQTKLRSEIDGVRDELNHKPPTYEALQKMKYLDMVVSETLRRWPPLGLTNRKCTKDYTFSNYDGTSITIEKGVNVFVPVQAFHLDERFYPDPLTFNPERFADPSQLNQNAYAPFGAGIRNCIGSRLALMQAKCILYYMLSNFTIEPCAKTHIPLVVDVKSLGLNSTHGFWLNFVPRAH